MASRHFLLPRAVYVALTLGGTVGRASANREMDIPVDIVMNRCDPDAGLPEEVFGDRRSRVIARIPESRAIAQIGSTGGLAALESTEFAGIMDELLGKILSAERGAR